jgi:23S rRNA pseudouridine1911/1915/1917 synthase
LDNDKIPVKKELIAGDDAVGKRLDKYISANAGDNFSRARVQALVRTGHVLVNGEKPKGTSQRLKAGDVIHFNMPPPEQAEPIAENIPLDILYEDEHLIVVNKPAGMVVHPAPGHWTGTLVNALLFHCGDSLSGIGGVKRPGIVHRLDKNTSGVMVVAKSYNAHQGLTAQFADHGRNGPLKRQYLALVWGMPARHKGSIDAPLGRHPNNRIKRGVVSEDRPDAKQAITHFTIRDIYGEEENRDPIASLIQCTLETGRTHQIRVHMAHIDHPLIGDQEYGLHFQTKSNKLPGNIQKSIQGLNRQALHAESLGFLHPVLNEYIEFSSPPPADLQAVIDVFSVI